MNVKNLKFLRVFIFLLTTVFLVDTVYASGMMAAAQVSANHTEIEAHCLEKNHGDTHLNHHHDAQKKQSSNTSCSKCSHCMACFSALPPSQLEILESHTQQMTNTLFKPSYHSHVSAQPHRPPIS